MMLINLDEFLRQNCVDRMDGKSCEECKHHVLEVSCERLMEQPTIDPVKHGKWIEDKYMSDVDSCIYTRYICSSCGAIEGKKYSYCHCGAKMEESEGK